MSDDYERLLLAAQTLHPQAKIDGPKALADLVGVTPQVMTNWKARGLPKGKIGDLAKCVGCRFEYLAYGEMPIREDEQTQPKVRQSLQDMVNNGEQYAPITPDEAQLIYDLRCLFADTRAELVARITEAAEQSRKAEREVLARYGHPVPDEKVARTIKPAPTDDGPRRRATDFMVRVPHQGSKQ